MISIVEDNLDIALARDGNEFLYGRKEIQDKFDVDWYDSGARYQTTSGIFSSIDPQAEKQYGISPYAYCAGNPMNSMDPNGDDEWNINSKGEIVGDVIKTKEHDAFYIVNDKGERMLNEDGSYRMKSFDYGTITRYGNSEGMKNTNPEHSFDYYEVKGKDNAAALFEYMAENTNVEWSHLSIGMGEGAHTVSTSHKEGSESGGCYFIHIVNGIVPILGFDHSHPSNSYTPSGSDTDSGDFGIAHEIESNAMNNKRNGPILRLYIPKNQEYKQYRYSDRPNYRNKERNGNIDPSHVKAYK